MSVTTIPQAQRGGSQTPIILGPVALPAGTTEVALQSTMPSSQVTSTSPTYEVIFAVQYSTDGGSSFNDWTSLDWVSGPGAGGLRGVGPGQILQPTPAMTHVRASLVIPTRMTLGATITITP